MVEPSPARRSAALFGDRRLTAIYKIIKPPAGDACQEKDDKGEKKLEERKANIIRALCDLLREATLEDVRTIFITAVAMIGG